MPAKKQPPTNPNAVSAKQAARALPRKAPGEATRGSASRAGAQGKGKSGSDRKGK